MQVRNYLLTINNPEKNDNELKEYIEKLEHLKYCVFQREKGEQQKTEHIQMYIEFSISIRFNRMKKCFPKAHIEKRRGTRKQARDYCMKPDTRIGEVIEIGEWVDNQGKRTDLDDITDLIFGGADEHEIMFVYPKQYLLYQKHIQTMINKHTEIKYKKEYRDIKCIYINGKSGVGKSTYVLEKYGLDKVYRITDYKYPWDNYNYEKVVAFEEFHGQVKITDMLNYLDNKPCILPCRYNNKVAGYNIVFILTNKPFNQQYQDIALYYNDTFQAFKRRFHYNQDLSNPAVGIFDINERKDFELVDKYLELDKIIEKDIKNIKELYKGVDINIK